MSALSRLLRKTARFGAAFPLALLVGTPASLVAAVRVAWRKANPTGAMTDQAVGSLILGPDPTDVPVDAPAVPETITPPTPDTPVGRP